MEILLRNVFTQYHNLPTCNADIVTTINARRFEIGDENKEVVISYQEDEGILKVRNSEEMEVVIINYDKFMTSLPSRFNRGIQRCDLIIYKPTRRDCFTL